MFSQLKEEQKYWRERLKIERLQVLLDREIDLYDEINAGIYKAEALSKEAKVFGIEFVADMKIAELSKESISKTNKHNDKLMEHHKHIYELSAKLQMAELYFGSKVDQLINPLEKEIENNFFNNNIMTSDSLDIYNIEQVLGYMNRHLETTESLNIARKNLLKEMRCEIDQISKQIYSSGDKN